jgi:hypothetical protein
MRRTLLAAPFYFDARSRELGEAFPRRFPEGHELLLLQADRALAGDLRWIGPGTVPDWRRALPGEERWPDGPSERISVGDAKPIGDVRLAWELGRCSHLVRLAQAAWLTREKSYAEAALDGLVDFADANPPGFGIGWLHAQEVALRATSWLWVFRLLGESPAFTGPLFERWLGQMEAHASFVEAFLTDAPVTHNHRLTELAALFVLGTALPVLPGARRWRRIGARGLAAEVLRQLYPDGPSGEGSTHYHGFVLDSCVAALLLAERAATPFPSRVLARTAAGLDFLRWLIRHDGTLPAIGDSDAGRAFRLGLDPLDRRDLLAAGAVLFQRNDWGSVAGDAAGAFWLTGGREVPGARGPRPEGGAAAFRDAGFAVARSGYAADEEIAVFRVGPGRLLPDVLTSHLHADALSVTLRLGSVDLLRDPGTYLYSEGEGWRPLFRATASHNCVVIDDRSQTDVSERFGLGPVAPATWCSFHADAARAGLEAEHPSAASPRVRRRVVWLRGGTLLLCDDVLGDGTHEVEAWLQLPAGQGEPAGNELELRLAGGPAVRIRAVAGASELRVRRPGERPGAGWYAPRYGVREPATAVQLSAGRVHLPHRLVTLFELAAEGVPARVTETSGGEIEMAWPGGSVSLPRDGGILWRGAPAPAAR